MNLYFLLEEIIDVKSKFTIVEVYKNPTKTEYTGLLREIKRDAMARGESYGKSIRWLYDNNILYIWDAYKDTHHSMKRKLNLDREAIEGYIFPKSNSFNYHFAEKKDTKDLNKKMKRLGLNNDYY